MNRQTGMRSLKKIRQHYDRQTCGNRRNKKANPTDRHTDRQTDKKIVKKTFSNQTVYEKTSIL